MITLAEMTVKSAASAANVQSVSYTDLYTTIITIDGGSYSQ